MQLQVLLPNRMLRILTKKLLTIMVRVKNNYDSSLQEKSFEYKLKQNRFPSASHSHPHQRPHTSLSVSDNSRLTGTVVLTTASEPALTVNQQIKIQ